MRSQHEPRAYLQIVDDATSAKHMRARIERHGLNARYRLISLTDARDRRETHINEYSRT